MKKIYFLHKHPTKLGDVIEYKGFKATITEELIELNPKLFTVKDTMQELLDKAKTQYPVGTVFKNEYGIQKVLSDKPFVGKVRAGTVQINTDQFPGGAAIYTPEDGWAEILPLKFITEDGVSIYGDMKTYLVHPDYSADICFSYNSWNGNSGYKSNKYFYHKENALAYIEKHKEKTLEDYENILCANEKLLDNNGYHNGDMYNISIELFFKLLKANEPKLYYTKILQLIADDLNSGWKPDFNNERQKKYFIDTLGVKVHCSVNYGLVYFKSMCLAQKARAILGCKINYLFN